MRKDPFGKNTLFIIRLHNFQSPRPETTKVVERVKGRGPAEKRVNLLDRQLTPEQRAAGWSHFLQ